MHIYCGFFGRGGSDITVIIAVNCISIPKHVAKAYKREYKFCFD
jgi:hypothetical protein